MWDSRGLANGITKVVYDKEVDTASPAAVEGEACHNDLWGKRILFEDPEEDNIEDEDWNPKKEDENVADNEDGYGDDINDFEHDFRHRNVKGKQVSDMVDQNVDKAIGSRHKGSIEARHEVNSSSDDEEGRGR